MGSHPDSLTGTAVGRLGEWETCKGELPLPPVTPSHLLAPFLPQPALWILSKHRAARNASLHIHHDVKYADQTTATS